MRVNGVDCNDNDYLILRNVKYEDFIRVMHCSTLRHMNIPKDKASQGGIYHFLNKGREGRDYNDFVLRNQIIIKSLLGEIGDYVIDARVNGESRVSSIHLWFKGVVYNVVHSYKPVMLEIDSDGSLIIRYTLYGTQGTWYQTDKDGFYHVSQKELRIMMPVLGVPMSKLQFKRGLLF